MTTADPIPRMVGAFGTYLPGGDGKGRRKIIVYSNNPDRPQVGASTRLVIYADDIAPFVTELIEMARVLGVTGQEKGND